MNQDSSCSKGFISVIIVYAISLMYLFQKNTKFWGYIMMIIAYIFSYGYIFQFRDVLGKGANDFTNFLNITLVSKETVQIGVALVLFSIFFFNLYNLIKILNAYSFKSTKTGTFDLKLNKRHAKKLDIFNWSFIVGNAAMYVFIYYLVSSVGYTLQEGKTSFTSFKSFFLLVSFICVWIGLGTATEFSYIKRE
jgi:hypothetical protein